MTRPALNDPHSRSDSRAWYRQPIIWMGAAVLAASIAGCVWLIVVAERHADPPLPIVGMQILKMPLKRPPPPQTGPQP